MRVRAVYREHESSDRKMNALKIGLGSCVLAALCSCSKEETEMKTKGAYADDLAFMRQYVEVIELHDGRSAVAIAPAYQGRVMTSTYDSETGPSFGWINRPVIAQGVLSGDAAKGKLQEHIHVFGGEERFWLGPEGGQFSIFFKPKAKFEFSDWFTPPSIDTEAFTIESKSDTEVVFSHQTKLQNWSGTEFHVGITRVVRLLDRAAIEERLGIEMTEELEIVAYETENTIRNNGDTAWTKDTGMLSIWILGMYPPSPGTRVVIPFKGGSEGTLGPKVNDTYFGKVPPEYLKIEDDILFFKGDGTHRGKIGIGPRRAKGVAGSYDPGSGVLNIVTHSKPGPNPGYVNSMWELQEDPLSGDVINAYNDGAPEPGADPLGPFYELETSSPAADLEPGDTLTHVQATIHLRGAKEEVNRISEKVLGADLDRIMSAF